MSLSYRLFGSLDQPVLVCLHGFLGSSSDFLELLPLFPPTVCYLLVDLPGHGHSALLEESSFFSFAHALHALFSQLNLKKVSFLGYSMGGRLALSFADLYPDFVSCVILESVHPGLMSELEKRDRLVHDHSVSFQMKTLSSEDFLKQWYSQPLFYPLELDQIIPYRQSVNLNSASEALLTYSLGHQPYYESFSCKTYYIYGSFDSKFSLFASHFSQSFCVYGAGHLVHFMFKEVFATLILDILKKEVL